MAAVLYLLSGPVGLLWCVVFGVICQLLHGLVPEQCTGMRMMLSLPLVLPRKHVLQVGSRQTQ